jgi:hypothetical protein
MYVINLLHVMDVSLIISTIQMKYIYKNITIENVKTVVVWLQQNLLKKKIVRILNQYKKRVY